MYSECPLARPPFPPHLIARSRELLESTVALLRPVPVSREAARMALQRYPHHAEQVHQVSREVDVDPVELMMANLSYDLSLALFGCSTMALATASGPVVARNMDWMMPDKIARASCVTPLPRGLSAGFAGSVGVISGLSDHGFAVMLNAVVCGRVHLDGYPVLLFLRHLLDEATSFEQAVDLASTTPLATSALITLAGTRNPQRVCVECSATACRLRWAEGAQPLLVTNHYRRLAPAEACPRYAHLERHSPRLPPSPAPEDLLALLTHDNVRQSITAQHVLACPATGSLRLFVPTDLLTQDRGGDVDPADLSRFF
jgi:hypothetical protein